MLGTGVMLTPDLQMDIIRSIMQLTNNVKNVTKLEITFAHLVNLSNNDVEILALNLRNMIEALEHLGSVSTVKRNLERKTNIHDTFVEVIFDFAINKFVIEFTYSVGFVFDFKLNQMNKMFNYAKSKSDNLARMYESLAFELNMVKKIANVEGNFEDEDLLELGIFKSPYQNRRK